MVFNASLRNCLLCNRAFRGRTFLCRECSDRYRREPPTLEVRRHFYEMLDIEFGERSNTYGEWNEPAALMRVIDRLPRHVRLLEIGAGGGFLGRRLVDLGFQDVTLLEVSDTAAAEIQRRVPEAYLVIADAERLPFKAGVFDVVISSDLLEHLPDASEHINEVVRVLDGTGLYLIKTPNRLIAEPFYRALDIHDAHFWHPSMFSPSELRRELDRAGMDAHFMRPQHLTGAQLAKLPVQPMTAPIAGRLPLDLVPHNLHPHLEVVARKRPVNRA